MISLTSGAFDALADGIVPSDLRLQDGAIAQREMLRMLADLNHAIAADFSPSAWMIVDDGEIVGLCSIIRPPENGELHIGYGVAPPREGRGGTAPTSDAQAA
jgi:RimJ/RimL family protein N-acetyltransferase